jgi:hypothetical protein
MARRVETGEPEKPDPDTMPAAEQAEVQQQHAAAGEVQAVTDTDEQPG